MPVAIRVAFEGSQDGVMSGQEVKARVTGVRIPW